MLSEEREEKPKEDGLVEQVGEGKDGDDEEDFFPDEGAEGEQGGY